MRKLLVLALALAIPSSVMAAGIPTVVSPTTDPEIWTTEVFNNSGGALTSGDVVIWDFDSSTGDNLNYITTTATGSHPRVAGVVVSSSIAAASTGTIAIRGPVVTNEVVSTQCTADDLVSTTTTAKKAGDYSDAADNGHLGLCIKNTSNADQSIVFVNPGWAD